MIDIAIRHPHRRRSAVTGAAAMSTAVLLVLAGCTGDAPVPPTPPTPPVSSPPEPGSATPAPPVPDPSATDAVTPTETESESAPDATAPASAVSIDFATYEFELEATSTSSDEVSRYDDVTGQWAVDPCRPTEYPTDAAKSQFARAGTYVGDSGRFVQLAQYPDESTASEVLAGFSRALESCGRLAEPEPVVGSDLVQWQLFDPAPLGQESLTFQSTEYVSDFGLPGSDVVVVRIDALVLVVGTDSLYAGTMTDAERVASVTELATAEVARLEAALAAS